MKPGRLARTCLKVAFLVALATGIPHLALALPKSPQGGGGGKCDCLCAAYDGTGHVIVKHDSYNSKGYACSAFVNKTCNMTNPNTGGIATGSLLYCNSGQDSRARVIVFSPFGGVIRPPMKP
jgi:hypothetical protein